MKILVKSVEDAFAYVMDHYAPAGMEEMANRTDTYAVISILKRQMSVAFVVL